MFTRQEYLNASREDGMAAHRKYYGQLVTPEIIQTVVSYIGADKIKASKDQHFNDIPLERWDGLMCSVLTDYVCAKMRDLGDVNIRTPSNAVCIAKESARQWLEQQSV